MPCVSSPSIRYVSNHLNAGRYVKGHLSDGYGTPDTALFAYDYEVTSLLREVTSPAFIPNFFSLLVGPRLYYLN